MEGSESILSDEGAPSKKSIVQEVSILEKSEHEVSISPRNVFVPPMEFPPRGNTLGLLSHYKQTLGSSKENGLYTVEEVNSTT